MKVEIRSVNVKVSEERRLLIEKKLGKLDRYLENLNDAFVELSTEKVNKGAEGILVVSISLKTPSHGPTLRGSEKDYDLGTALDRLTDKMQRQISDYKNKISQHKGRSSVGTLASQLEKENETEEELSSFEEEDM